MNRNYAEPGRETGTVYARATVLTHMSKLLSAATTLDRQKVMGDFYGFLIDEFVANFGNGRDPSKQRLFANTPYDAFADEVRKGGEEIETMAEGLKVAGDQLDHVTQRLLCLTGKASSNGRIQVVT